ncbi:hypothetical protein DPEC_G00038110 [Dallia pectoralis]|uniref:Uncharacterized protein n=1 Tax=Dallia pectoralis TaxID=75939 RepID=A0ACC2HER8_DALPE|nr:hypothetical protein DPEC_G00038110 [Dallia pectoralis]
MAEFKLEPYSNPPASLFLLFHLFPRPSLAPRRQREEEGLSGGTGCPLAGDFYRTALDMQHYLKGEGTLSLKPPPGQPTPRQFSFKAAVLHCAHLLWWAGAGCRDQRIGAPGGGLGGGGRGGVWLWKSSGADAWEYHTGFHDDSLTVFTAPSNLSNLPLFLSLPLSSPRLLDH